MRIWMAAIILMAAACADGSGPATSTMDQTATVSFAANLNAFRADQGLGTVTTNRRLQRAAQAHAEDMEKRGYFSHQSVGGPNGTSMSDRIAASGYRACAAAENIAQGQKSESEVFAAWRGSAGHRRNMLGPRYVEYGLGRSGNTWVQLLAAGC